MKKNLFSLFLIPVLALAASCNKGSCSDHDGGERTYSYTAESVPFDETWLDGGYTKAAVLDITFNEAATTLNDMDIFVYRNGSLESYVYADNLSDIRVTYEDAAANYNLYVFGNTHGKLMSWCAGASGSNYAAKVEAAFASESTMQNLSLPVCDNYSEFFINGFPQAKAYKNWIPRNHVGEPLRTSRLVSAFVLTTTRAITEANFYNGPTHIIPFKEQLSDEDRASGFGVEKRSPMPLTPEDLQLLNDPGKGLTFFFLENLQGANIFPAGTTSRTKKLDCIQDILLRNELQNRLSYIELKEEGEDEPVRIFLGNNADNRFFENCDIRRNTILYMSYKGTDAPLNPGLYIKCNSRYSDMKHFFGEEGVCFNELVPGYGNGSARFGSSSAISVDNFEVCAVGDEYRRAFNGRNYDVSVHGASSSTIHGSGEKSIGRTRVQDMVFPHIGREDFDGTEYSGNYSVDAYPYFGIAVVVAGNWQEAERGNLSIPLTVYWAVLDGGVVNSDDGEHYVCLRPVDEDFDCYFINLLGDDVVTEINLSDPSDPIQPKRDGLYFRNGVTLGNIEPTGTYSSQYPGVNTSEYDGEVYFYRHSVGMEYDSNGSCLPYVQIDSEGQFEYYIEGVEQQVNVTVSQPTTLRSDFTTIHRVNSAYPYSDGKYTVGDYYAYVTLTVSYPGGSQRIWGYITETDNFGGMFKYCH